MAAEVIQHLSSNPRPSILVVEDNPDLQDYIRLILSEKYEVVTVGNGQQALELLTLRPTTKFYLILSDLMMPVMDGYQLLEQLKSNNTTAHIPVVMLTARAEMQDKLKALRIGVDDYLLKPFEEEELLVRIENLLKNQSERLKALEHDNASEAPGPLLSQKDREWLESFESYLKARDGQASISVVSAKVGYADPRSFSRSFKKRFGKLPSKI